METVTVSSEGAAAAVPPDVRWWLDRWANRLLVGVLLLLDLVVTPGLVESGEFEGVRAVDGSTLVALALFVGGVVQRRRRPLLAFGLVVVGYLVVAEPVPSLAAMVGIPAFVTTYSVGSWSTHRRRATALVGVVGLLLWAGSAGDSPNLVAALVAPLALLAVPFLVGQAVRNRRLYVEAVEERLADVEARREAQAREAVVAERNRIARELHDVVAHHVSLIGVQAGAARASLDVAPERAREALRGIEGSARSAVEEMRHLLGALQDDGAAAERAPAPGLAQLEGLIASFRGAGLDVRADVPADLGDLPPTVDLHAHRVVEEALTNVVRHSAAGRADVTIVRSPSSLGIEVVDPGPARDEPTTRGSGRGLVGMRERVNLAGGTLVVGPEGPGFRVRATLPLGATLPLAATGEGQP